MLASQKQREVRNTVSCASPVRPELPPQVAPTGSPLPSLDFHVFTVGRLAPPVGILLIAMAVAIAHPDAKTILGAIALQMVLAVALIKSWVA